MNNDEKFSKEQRALAIFAGLCLLGIFVFVSATIIKRLYFL